VEGVASAGRFLSERIAFGMVLAALLASFPSCSLLGANLLGTAKIFGWLFVRRSEDLGLMGCAL
jgi:hypothetical protein